MGSDQQDKDYDSGIAEMAWAELTGMDYFMHPMVDLLKHPDYNHKAMIAISAISQMTSAQIEALNIEEKI